MTALPCPTCDGSGKVLAPCMHLRGACPCDDRYETCPDCGAEPNDGWCEDAAADARGWA